LTSCCWGFWSAYFVHRAERQIFGSSPLNKVLLAISVLTYLSLWQGAFYLGGPLPISFDDRRFSDWKNYVEMFFSLFCRRSFDPHEKANGYRDRTDVRLCLDGEQELPKHGWKPRFFPLFLRAS